MKSILALVLLAAFIHAQKPNQKSLLIIFDGTGSMSTDLAQLKTAAKKIVVDYAAQEDKPIFNYVLDVFRDPGESKNPLIEQFLIIKIGRGRECTEHTKFSSIAESA